MEKSPQREGKYKYISLLHELAAIFVLVIFWAYFCNKIFLDFNSLYKVGMSIDAIGQVWMTWWSSVAFSTEGLSPFFCPLLNYPVGSEVMTFDVAFINILISGFFVKYLGVIGAINAVFVTSLLFGLIATYVMIRQVTTNRILALFLSIISGIYIITHLVGFVDVDMANFGFVAFAVAFWIRYLKTKSRVIFVFASLFFALTCIFQMYYGINLIIFFSIMIIASLAGIESLTSPFTKTWRPTLAIMGFGTLLAMPFFIATMNNLEKVKTTSLVGGQTNEHLSLAIIPFIFLIIFVFALFKRKSKKLMVWAFAIAIFSLFSVGLQLEIPGTYTTVPMPFKLFQTYIPFFWRYNFTDRFGRMAILLLPIFLAMINSNVQSFFPDKSSIKKSVMTIFILFLMAKTASPLMVGKMPTIHKDLMPITAMRLMDVPEVVLKMNDDKEKYVVFELYCEEDSPFTPFFQVYHQKPIAGEATRPEMFFGKHKLSELSLLQKRFCDSAKLVKNILLPPLAWWKEQQVRYLVLNDSFIARKGGNFMEEWESAYGNPVSISQQFRFYDLNLLN